MTNLSFSPSLFAKVLFLGTGTNISVFIPFLTTSILDVLIRCFLTSCSLNESVTVIIFHALLYMRCSRNSKKLIIGLVSMAPTALMDSGQRSRTSMTHLFRFQKLSHLAEITVKNWGEVAIMISVLMKRPTVNEANIKLR